MHVFECVEGLHKTFNTYLIYNFTCLSVCLSRSWKLSPRTSNSRSQKQFRTSSSYVRFRAATAGNGCRQCCNLQAPFVFFLYLQLSNHLAISKLPLLSFCICSFPITSQSPSSLCFLFVSAAFQSPRKFDDRFWEEWQQGIIDNQVDKRTLEVGLKHQPEKTKNLYNTPSLLV